MRRPIAGSGRLVRRPVAVCAGLVADRLLGEPPPWLHPVAGFGWVMTALERGRYRDSRWAGAAHAGAGVAVAGVAGLAVGSPAVATWLACAGRQLGDSAVAVAVALEDGDLERARSMLPVLVGRDVDGLDDKEAARAAVESVAENTVDAVVAPVLWALGAGAAGAFVHRALNTLDAMVGHRSPRYARFGWAAARADDAAAWVPARTTAVLVAIARPSRAGDVRRAVRRDAGAHPSPNAGVAEAAFAAALGVRLGGEISYGGLAELRPQLGDGPPPVPADILRAVRLSRDVTVALGAALLAVAAAAAAGTAARHRSPRRRPESR